MKKSSTHIYTFYNSRMHLCIKATNFVEAIEWLKVIFGDDWVKNNIDDLDVSWYKPNKK